MWDRYRLPAEGEGALEAMPVARRVPAALLQDAINENVDQELALKKVGYIEI